MGRKTRHSRRASHCYQGMRAIRCRVCFLYPPDSATYTKYSMNYKREISDISHKVNYTGNHAKSLHLSIRDSLKKLRTSYIDILYVHFWEYSTSVEEVMDALHALVIQGKVLYLVRALFPSRSSLRFFDSVCRGFPGHPRGWWSRQTNTRNIVANRLL